MNHLSTHCEPSLSEMVFFLSNRHSKNYIKAVRSGLIPKFGIVSPSLWQEHIRLCSLKLWPEQMHIFWRMWRQKPVIQYNLFSPFDLCKSNIYDKFVHVFLTLKEVVSIFLQINSLEFFFYLVTLRKNKVLESSSQWI